MALNSSKIKGNNPDRVDQPAIEPGVYPARICQIVDLGLQTQRPFQGKEKPPANEISISYELVDCFMVDKDGKEQEDKPRWISEIIPLYDVSKADKSKCSQRYKAADPNNNFGGDFSKIVDIPVNVSIVHNQQGDKLYINVANIAAMRPKDADKCPPLKNPHKVFDLDDPDVEVFLSFPDWLQERIKKNLQYNGSPLQLKLEGKPAAKAEQPKKQEAAEEEEEKAWD